jgi:DNA-binding response OmpR family regulator
MTTDGALEVAWIELDRAQDTLQVNHQHYFPALNCRSFSVEDEFRASFCKDRYDAVLCVCDCFSENEARAIIGWIRSVRCSKIPVLILTDNNDEYSVAQALYAGADDVQHLPVLPAILCARLKALCSRAAIAQTTA